MHDDVLQHNFGHNSHQHTVSKARQKGSVIKTNKYNN